MRFHDRIVGVLFLTTDKGNLLALTGYLTQNPLDIEEMFRRMIFNYLTENNGEHATSVNGTGHPTVSDFITVGTKIKTSKKVCYEIIDYVTENCAELKRYKL